MGNRLGGNSLLDCVVFGRVAGKHCAQYMLGADMKPTSLIELSGGGLSGDVQASKNAGGSYEDDMNKGKAGGGGAAAAAPGASAGGPSISKEEVAKHNNKESCWVILHDRVLDVTDFLKDHPGGALAILTFAGKDATEEFDMIHPPDVIGKYAPNAIIGKVGEAPAGAAAPAMPKAAPARKELGGLHANHHAWGQDGNANWRIDGYDDNPGVFIINVKSYIYATIYLWIAIILEVLKTIFCNKNFKINATDRVGLTRSAILLILFIVIHAVGNLHVFAGPDDFNGYGYFYARLYWTGFGLPANIVEEYILLSALLHVTAGLAKTWNRIGVKGSIIDGNLNLGMTGVVLLVFMSIHLFQFRFGATSDYFLRPPPFLVFFGGITKLQLFWTTDESVEPVKVRDIYRLEFDRFLGKNSYNPG